MMCHHAIEAAGFGKFPRSVGACCPLRKSKRAGPTENLPPPALYAVCIHSKTGRKGGGFGRGRCGRTSDKKTSKWTSKRHFLRSCQKFKKIRKTFLQEKVKKRYKVLNKFSCNLRSKLARSSLTSLGPIRIKSVSQERFSFLSLKSLLSSMERTCVQ
jgi:hypothetical protein